MIHVIAFRSAPKLCPHAVSDVRYLAVHQPTVTSAINDLLRQLSKEGESLVEIIGPYTSTGEPTTWSDEPS